MANQIVVSAGAKVRNLQDVIIGTSGVLTSLGFDVANGVPRLDVNGKILVSQLPNSVMEYKGTWDASTNTPTLVNGTGNQGDVYLCNVAGTVNFGAGAIAFVVGDQVIYSGSIWQRASGATGTVTSVAVTESGDSLNITGSPITTSGTINIGFNGTNLQYVNGAGNLTTFPTLITSIGLSMPSAFSVANSPLTANGTIAVTGAGVASQYIRGDGTLADFPSSGGGGSSVSYYLNGGTSQGTIGGTTYYEMSKTAVIGTGVDFAKSGDGFIVAFLTDANDPAQLNIPAGNWNYEIYASMSSNGGTPQMYAELYKYDGTTFTLISTSSNEILYDGTALNLYTFAMAVPDTSLTLTDRLAVKLYSTNSGGKTTTIHTQDGHLCQIITTFSTGITALNGLTAQVQYFQTGTSGTDFNISSTTATHTFNIPDASATARGLITTGTQTIAGIKTFTSGINVDYIGVTGDISMDGSFLLKQVAYGTLQSGYTNLSGQTNGLRVGLFGGYNALLNFSTSGSYTYTFPNATGTIALVGGSGVGTVTSVAALTIGTSGTDLSSTVATSTTTPVITLNVPTASATNRGALSSADWSTFNSKQGTITLTTTGTSGAATFSSNTLNIPNYGSALSGYLPLTGGTLTGALNGTSASFSSSVTATSELRIKSAAYPSAYNTSLRNDISGTGILQLGNNNDNYILIGNTNTNGYLVFRVNCTTESITSGSLALTLNSNATATFASTVTATSFIKTGGSSSQFLKADGSVDSSTYLTTSSASSTYLPLAGGTLTGDLSISYTTSNLRLFLNNTTATTGRSWYFNSFSNGNLYIGNTTASDVFNFSSAGVATFIYALNGTSATFSSTGIFGNASLNGAYLVVKGANGVPTSSGTTTTAVFRISSGTGLYNVLDFGTNESLDYSWIQSTRANSLGTYDYLAIQPNGGNLLVGTLTNSTYKLDVNGTGRFSQRLNVTQAASNIIIANYDGNNRMEMSANGFNLVGGNNFTIQQASGASQFTLNHSTGAATFSSTIQAVNQVKIFDSGYPTAYATSLRTATGAVGVLQLGNNNDNYILAGNYATGGYLIFKVNCATESISAGTEAFRLASNAAATFTSSVTATGFFESSSIKGKDIIATNPLLALDIDVIKYTRKSDESKDIRYGYSAEQIHSLMPELTDKDVTAVKYLDVHTILISQLQKEIKELKAKMN